MFKRIMQHDWRNLTADRTFWILLVVLALAIGFGAYNGISWMRFQQRAISLAQADEARRYTNLSTQLAALEANGAPKEPFRDPRSPYGVGNNLAPRYAVMPPTQLAALSIGQSDLFPYYVKVSTRSQTTFTDNEEIENPLNLLAGRFDLAFVILSILPLVAIGLGYNLISAEKEQGTLAMTLSNPVSLAKLVAGKALLRMSVTLGVVVGISLAAFAASRPDWSAAGVWSGLVLWGAVTMLYAAFWFGLAVLVNTFGKSSATNAVTLTGAWLAFVVVIPSVINLVATTLYPTPSRVEYLTALREASRTAQADGSRLLAKYYEDHPEFGGKDVNLEDFATRSYVVQETVERSMAPVTERFQEQLAAQQRFVNRFRFSSPAIVTLAALNDISGTNAERAGHFSRLVSEFHQQWKGYFIPRLFAKTKLSLADVDTFPRFAFREQPFASVVWRVVAGIAGLGLPTLAVWVLAFLNLRTFRLFG